MFFYEVGYIDWESNNTVVLWHQREFSEEEFNEIMLQCYVKISKKLEKKWMEFDDHKLHTWKPSVSEINSHIVDLLVSEWDFNKIKITAEFVPFDAHDLTDMEVGKKESEMGGDRALISLFKKFSKTEIRNDRIDDILKSE